MKYERVIEEISHVRGKITNYQNKLRDLERLKTEMENTEIISLVRGFNIAPENLREFITVYQKQQNGLPQAEPPAPPPAGMPDDGAKEDEPN